MAVTAQDHHHATGRLWTLAALVAVALHAGVAVMALAAGEVVDPDDSAGAMAMDIGLESEAPSSDSSVVEASADEAARAAATIARDVPTDVRPDAQPEVEPTPSGEDPPFHRVTAQETPPPDNKLPQEPETRTASVPTSAATAAIAAPSRQAEHDGSQSRARSLGSDAAAERRRAAWRQGLVAHLERHKRLPPGDRQASADVVVGFSIDRHGKVLSVEIVKGSGDRQYDDAALAMVRRADPVPFPPDEVAGRGLSFRLPVSFRNGG